MSLVTRNIAGRHYTFNPSRSHLLQRTLFDVYDEGHNEWICMKEAHYWSHRLQQAIVVPAWFVTDFASIPKFARWAISVNEKHRLAALPHDLVYCSNELGIDRPSRKTGDLILRDFCEVMEVEEWKTDVMYGAVRTGGWYRWRRPGKTVLVPDEYKPRYIEQHPELAHLLAA